MQGIALRGFYFVWVLFSAYMLGSDKMNTVFKSSQVADGGNYLFVVFSIKEMSQIDGFYSNIRVFTQFSDLAG